jgi:hypothetical protein
MGTHAVINAAINSARHTNPSQRAISQDQWASTNIPHLQQVEEQRRRERQPSYGATSSSSTSPLESSPQLHASQVPEPGMGGGDDEQDGDGRDDAQYEEIEVFEPVIDGEKPVMAYARS